MDKVEQKIPTYTRYGDLKRLAFIKSNLDKYIQKSGQVLDVGCGNGIISMHLGKEGYNIHGLEISPEAVAKAKKTNPFPNVEFKQGDAESIKGTGIKYDAVICSEVLEHLNNPGKLLKELHDLLEDNGILIVTVPNGIGPRELLVTRPYLKIRDKLPGTWKLINKLKSSLGYSGKTIQSEASDLDHIQFFSKKELKKLSSSCMFKIIDTKASNFIDDIFPVSLLTKRIFSLQKLDAKVADFLPNAFSGGFLMIWKKS